MKKKKILLISSVLPLNTTGGEVVLYRHFSQCSEISLVIATNSTSKELVATEIIEISSHPILARLTKTRFSKLAHGICQLFNIFSDIKLCHYIKQNQPDLIITVAHGELCWLAQQMSQKFQIPLVTFFHDWWPDLAYVHSWTRKIITSRFKKLYQDSNLALCVSEEMRDALGSHSNSQILFPIPEKTTFEKVTTIDTSKEKLTVIYTGSLSGIYRPMLQQLYGLSQQQLREFNLKLFGSTPDWQISIVKQLEEERVYGGFLSREALTNELKEADILLVVMSFKLEDKMRMQTSFPSKLVDYCQFGKPIIIWGPEYCSAVRWAKKYQSALVVTSPSPANLVDTIKDLGYNIKLQKLLQNKVLEMAQGMFKPDKLQQQFIDSLENVAA